MQHHDAEIVKCCSVARVFFLCLNLVVLSITTCLFLKSSNYIDIFNVLMCPVKIYESFFFLTPCVIFETDTT